MITTYNKELTKINTNLTFTLRGDGKGGLCELDASIIRGTGLGGAACLTM